MLLFGKYTQRWMPMMTAKCICFAGNSIGGKVSTGAEIQNQNQSFFDNVALEYRLDDTANKYVTLFYENNVYDWLDGYTQEYGVGFIWRRSLQHFKDIFNFKSDEKQPLMPPMIRRDSPAENPTDSTMKVQEDSMMIRPDSTVEQSTENRREIPLK